MVKNTFDLCGLKILFYFFSPRGLFRIVHGTSFMTKDEDDTFVQLAS
jgi:hypothetical protein